MAEIEKDDNKLFICDNGIVVDDRINCPQKCPFNTPLEGVYVMDLDVCNTQPGVGVTCPLDTDLPGVVVTDEANCNIFEVCDASSTPLGQALNQDVKVADSALCQLSNVPNLQICEDGPFEGFAVNDQDACDTLDNVQICSLTSDLPGVLTTDPATCNIFETCDLNTPLGASLGTNVEVVDADICQLQFAVCDSDSGLARALGLTGPIVVADEQLCELEVTSGTTTCPAGSDLAGVVVTAGQADVICNLEIPQVVTCDSDSPLGEAVGQGTVQVTDVKLCELAITSGTTTCPAGSDLEGVVVLEGQANVICNLNIPTLVTCPTTSDIAGAQVTDIRICDLDNIDLIPCAAGTNNAGALVTDERLCQAPNDQNKCPPGSDLENVYVMNPDLDGACDIFEECEPDDPIFSALPEGSSTFEVVDDQICELTIPPGSEVDLIPCDGVPGNNLPPGALVTDEALCTAATPAEQCPPETDLEGVWVVDAGAEGACDIELTVECPPGTLLAGATVTDEDLCDLVDVENKECQICATLVNTILAPSAANIVFDAINAYDPSPPDGETGLEAICTSDDPITAAYNTFVDQIPNPPADPGLQLFLKNEFANCEGIEQTCGLPTVDATIDGPFAQPRDIAFDPVFDRMYVVTRDGAPTSGSVSVINTTNNLQIPGSPILNVGTNPFGVAYDPINLEMYVTDCENTGCTTVSRINTTSTPPALIPGPITVGTSPLNLAYDPGHQTMYVTNFGGTTVSVIDTTQNPPVTTDTIGGFNQPWGVAYDPFHETMYVTNFGNGTVSVIDTETNTVVGGPIAVGTGPTDITYDAIHERMYVTNFGSDSVSVIDTETNTVIDGPIAGLGDAPVYVTFDPINLNMYVTNQQGTTVSVIDTITNTVIDTIAVQNAPIGIAYDPENQRMYVGNRDSNSVSVINICPI